MIKVKIEQHGPRQKQTYDQVPWRGKHPLLTGDAEWDGNSLLTLFDRQD
jgi:hypothetical protein